MNSITLLVSNLNKGEGYCEYVLSSLKQACEFAGLQVNSISVSGDTTITSEFIRPEDVIDVEFTEIVREGLNEDNL